MTIGFLLISCSSSNSISNYHSYFKFTVDNENYDAEETYNNLDICWIAQIDAFNKVAILAKYKDASINENLCGVVIQYLNNNVGINNDEEVYISMGGNSPISAIGCAHSTVNVTQVGNYYKGEFSGLFMIVKNGTIINRQGIGSFMVPLLPN